MEFSGAVAAAYAEHRRGYPPPVVELLVDALGLPHDATVLDLGCGTGQLTVPLADRYSRVLGADPSPDMLALARSRSGGAPIAWLLADDRDVSRLPSWPTWTRSRSRRRFTSSTASRCSRHWRPE